MTRVIRGLLVGSVAAALIASFGASASAAEEPVAAPPTPSVLTSATNAMLRPAEVVAPLAKSQVPSGTNWFQTGFNNPPGGQDPMPVCSLRDPYTTVMVPMKMAIGFTARFDTTGQDVYQYPSQAAAESAWKSLSAKVASTCKGSGITTTPISGTPQALAVRTQGTGVVQYSVVQLIGDSIQLLTYYAQRSTIPSGVPEATRALAATLATRWADRENLVNTQDPILTKAQTDMLTVADIPASLPITAPTDGGWSTFYSYLPGTSPSNCNYRKQLISADQAFNIYFGGNGGPVVEPGSIGQSVYAYADAAAARVAWDQLSTTVLRCNQANPEPVSQTEPINRQSSGTSELSIDGVAGVWSRNLSTNPQTPGSSCTDSSGKVVDCGTWSSKSYQVYLLVGSTIQTVSYALSVDGVRNVPLDQVPVNQLAEELAQRWLQ